MELKIAKKYALLDGVSHASTIVQKCVHCGFCNATCPTYQLLGDELDGPRGRIYLIRSALEGNTVSTRTKVHIDRCLTCRSCETTCPSGVEFGNLLEIGRSLLEHEKVRPVAERLVRSLLRRFILSGRLLKFCFGIARTFRVILPGQISKMVDISDPVKEPPVTYHMRKMLLLDGCVQAAAYPSINAAVTRLLGHAGISTLSQPQARCCGALSLHLGATAEAKSFMRRNIDLWSKELDNGCESIVMTASGCGVTVNDYSRLFSDEQAYRIKADRVSKSTKDLSEVIFRECPADIRHGGFRRVALHSPCTLLHGQKVKGRIETLLEEHGYTLTYVRDGHLCCGSAGAYSLLNRKISRELLCSKVRALEADYPDIIATANIGCLLHLKKQATVPVKHWVELLVPAGS